MRIARVLAPNPSVYTLDGTNTWVLGREPAVVIDPGPPIEVHFDAVLREADGPVVAVLVTHDHEDHAEGALTFAERAGAPLRSVRVPGSELMQDAEEVHAGEVELRAIATPGHAADHLCFWAPGSGALFTGDTVVGTGTSFIDPPEGDLRAYLTSLGRLLELEPAVIYPGHGPVVTEAPAKLHEYIEHRAEREQQVIAALEGGARSIDELVSQIYAAYPPDVRPLAARQVLAHLRKLEVEGRATADSPDDDATWSLTAAADRPVAERPAAEPAPAEPPTDAPR